MKSRMFMQKIITAILISTIFLTGCKSGSKVKPPFDSNECIGQNIDAVIEQLEDAGFTNIQTEIKESTSNNGDVISVKIGEDSNYDTSDKYSSDVVISVQYYKVPEQVEEPKPTVEANSKETASSSEAVHEKIDVSMDILLTGETGKPQFEIYTNLPDGTELDFELSNDPTVVDGKINSYFEQSSATVKDGKAVTEIYTDNGSALKGQYTFYVSFLPDEQTEEVKAIVGEDGEYLEGDLVEGITYKYIVTSVEYNTDTPSNTTASNASENSKKSGITLDEISGQLDAALKSSFGNNYELSEDGDTILATVWSDGVAMTSVLATLGDEESIDAWNDIVASTENTTSIWQNVYKDNGYPDKVFVMSIQNDTNEENTLLVCMSGITIYDPVNNIDFLD